MPIPATCDLTSTNLAVYRGDTWGPHSVLISRGVTDGVTTSGSGIVTSATAEFTSGDVGATIASYTVSDAGVWSLSSVIPAGTTISSEDSITQVTMSANATASGTGRALKIGAKDLTGYTFLAQIRKGWNSASALCAITVTVTDADGGNLDLSMLPAVTSLLTPGDAVWDLQATSGAGVVETWLRGNVLILADSSRA